jgi:CDP-glucose 4,6-dehydratase
MNAQFWRGKRVFLTGHTGFKGSWLSLWLQRLGAIVAGYALPPGAGGSLHQLVGVGDHMESRHADIRDFNTLQQALEDFQPNIVFHLAAQPLVRRSYLDPLETYEVNVMGTAHVLEAIRSIESCQVVVVVTSDKCYENQNWPWGYRESDPLGGYDPYSSSKGCAELVTSAYRRSFYGPKTGPAIGVATARAGNVIGGGDFAQDRLVPDTLAALRTHATLNIRYPDAIRPWQHVLEPLSGYLLLAERLWEDPQGYSQGWNFGPAASECRSVRWIVNTLNELLGNRLMWQTDPAPKPHEENILILDSTQARVKLGWSPRWTLEKTLRSIAQWHEAYESGEALRETTIAQIADYEDALTRQPKGAQ